MGKAACNEVAIFIVGQSDTEDYRFGGVVRLPRGTTPETVQVLWDDFRRSAADTDFTDWLLERHKFIENQQIGFVILFE